VPTVVETVARSALNEEVPLRDGRLAHDPLEEPHETNFVETVTGGWRIEGYDDRSHVASFKVSPRSFLP
jgi:hypothetical protein